MWAISVLDAWTVLTLASRRVTTERAGAGTRRTLVISADRLRRVDAVSVEYTGRRERTAVLDDAVLFTESIWSGLRVLRIGDPLIIHYELVGIAPRSELDVHVPFTRVIRTDHLEAALPLGALEVTGELHRAGQIRAGMPIHKRV